MRKWMAGILAAALIVPGPAFAATVQAAAPMISAAPFAFAGAAPSLSALPPLAPAALAGLNAASFPVFAAPAAALPAAAPAAAAASAPIAPSAPILSPLAQAGAASAAASVKEPGPRFQAIFDGSAPGTTAAATAEPETSRRGGALARAVARPAAAAALFFNAALAHAAPAAAATPAHAAAWGHLFGSVAIFALASVVASAALAAIAVGIKKFREHRKEKAAEEAAATEASKGPKYLAWLGKGSGMTTLGLSTPGEASVSRTPATPQAKVTFADIAGQDEAKAELENVIDFLKNKDAYAAVNPDVTGPKGVLLIGPPGTGKTLIARAVAHEAGIPFRATKGSDFINQFVGTGAAGIRRVFEELKAEAKGGPAILFIDEIDSIGVQRSGDANNAEETRTLNALLAEMDGFEKDNILIIAATNRADMLDTALLRGGRFGLKIPVGLPDVVGREAVFKVHTKKMAMADDVRLDELAKQTPGLAGADLREIVNDVTMKVGKRRDKKATMADFLKGVDRFTTGHERRMVMRDDEKLAVSYHEAGHTLVSMLLPDADPVRKVTNIPHGLQALGFMQALPEQERMMYSREWLIDRMAVGLGGRVAEKMMTGRIYSGASNDFLNVTKIARLMVMSYGMSEAVGLVSYDSDGEPLQAGKPLSEKTRRLIDAEVRVLVKEAQSRAEQVLTAYRSQLKAMGDELMVKETLREDDLRRFVPKGVKFTPSPAQ